MKLLLLTSIFYFIYTLAAAQYSTKKIVPISSDSISSSTFPSNKLFAVAPNLYTQQFGFFCRKELQLEKATKVPIRFRLGSLSYCNYLEGKSTGKE